MNKRVTHISLRDMMCRSTIRTETIRITSDCLSDNKTYMIGTCRYTTINDAKFQIQLLFHRHFIENILNRDTSNEPLNDVLKSLKSNS